MMECGQPILLLHKHPVNINKINELSERFLNPVAAAEAYKLDKDLIRKKYHSLPKTFLSKSVTRAAGS
jgi:hypothetical protein